MRQNGRDVLHGTWLGAVDGCWCWWMAVWCGDGCGDGCSNILPAAAASVTPPDDEHPAREQDRANLLLGAPVYATTVAAGRHARTEPLDARASQGHIMAAFTDAYMGARLEHYA